jgi:hypothetical protein
LSHPHPVNVGYREWLTQRSLCLIVVEETAVTAAERLTAAAIAELRRKQTVAGVAIFADVARD